MAKSTKAGVSKTQVHVRTCEVCHKVGRHIIVVLLMYAIEKASGAVGQRQVKVHRCPTCLGG